MTRIEALRSAINAKVERSNSLRAALQEYATRDGDPTDEERAQFASDVAEFDAAGPEIERMQAELTQLETIANAPERAQVAGAHPAARVGQADLLGQAQQGAHLLDGEGAGQGAQASDGGRVGMRRR